MPVTSVIQHPERPSITVVADFPVPVARLWNAYADPRQIERFWGPPTYPAVFTRHDMFPGGLSHYRMTGPEGDVHCGYWKYLNVTPQVSFEVIDGFAQPDGSPNGEMPTMRMAFEFTSTAEGARVTTTTYFNSRNEFDELLEMGMLEGMHAAMSQIDGALADLGTFAADAAAQAQLLSDTQVRVSRVLRGTTEQVWRAHHDPELLRRWMLGPEGWTMPVCDVAREVGEVYRYGWQRSAGDEQFGFTGELLESHPPHRSVTTEQMIGVAGPGTHNELTLTALDGATLLSLVVTYPSKEVRDMVLGTGMVGGMETSYARLESDVWGL